MVQSCVLVTQQMESWYRCIELVLLYRIYKLLVNIYIRKWLETTPPEGLIEFTFLRNVNFLVW